MFRHIDLFSGIGGFAYAAKQVWGEEYETVCFCDINKYCQALLKLRFPGVPIYGDIAELIRDTGSEGNDRHFKQIDILTGGFPCQPFSAAGKRRGKDDSRFLWPAMLNAIRNTNPKWIIAENVSGILSIEDGMVFEQVCADMEAEGYEVWPFIIPACAVNAPHRRDRVWFIANRRRQRPQEQELKTAGREQCDCNAPDTDQPQPQGGGISIRIYKEYANTCSADSEWNKNWLEVATELCRVDDGLPYELDGFKLSKSRHRVERLKALGNAIVPQAAMNIMEVIKRMDAVKT